MQTADINAPVRVFMDAVASACDAHGQQCGLREILFCIRDIPYGRPAHPRDPFAVLANWKGTCSGKHLLASCVLDIMKANVRLFCQPYRLDDARGILPLELVRPYVGHGIWDVHNFLEIETGARPLKVDLTWSRELAGFGFPTTLAWDGTSNFQIAAPPGRAFPVNHPDELNERKEAFLLRLNSPAARILRERYIEDLTAFAIRHCRQRSREESVEGTLADIRERHPVSGAET